MLLEGVSSSAMSVGSANAVMMCGGVLSMRSGKVACVVPNVSLQRTWKRCVVVSPCCMRLKFLRMCWLEVVLSNVGRKKCEFVAGGVGVSYAYRQSMTDVEGVSVCMPVVAAPVGVLGCRTVTVAVILGWNLQW